MAVMTRTRLTRVILNSAAPERLARFYEEALGFVRVAGVGAQNDDVAAPGGLPGACTRALALALGDSRLDLTEARGRPYPDAVPGWSPLFQHCAIVTADFGAAMARLRRRTDWRAISTCGPEALPKRSGGVTAFKFRDPEGHPLELLSFPNGAGPMIWRRRCGDDPCLGIDHSAISVTDTELSVAFYASLGLAAGARSHNSGPEQERLDAVAAAAVEVTALNPPGAATPHLELLCYRGDFPRGEPTLDVDDVAATRLVFAGADMETLQALSANHAGSDIDQGGEPSQASGLLRDPDGHFLQLELAVPAGTRGDDPRP